MRLMLLGSRVSIIEKNNGTKEEIWKAERMKYSMNEITNRYTFIFYEK